VYAAILAGGKGKRFWPASTAARPKQFLDMTGEGSMLSLTWKRLRKLVEPDRILVLTASDQAGAVRAELPELVPGNLLCEPVSRNTAPSLAMAAAVIQARGSDDPVLCCPSDHLIADEKAFGLAVRSAADAAAKGDLLVTFGIEPSAPETGYGYIESSSGKTGAPGPLRVERFHEKPDRETAERYVSRGNYFWNSGIFVWRPSVFIEAWEAFLPEGMEPLRGISRAAAEGRLDEALAGLYKDMPSISVDFGILEKADNVVVVPVSIGWSDVGSWDALGDLLPADPEGNSGAGEMELIDSKGNIIYNPGGFTAVVGIEDMIVAVSGGKVLVCRRGESQRVREILERLEENDREEHC
jgi:mannose-1-phosphate guanylyltransferase/mannose-6-phosphate isomerase